MDSFWQDLQHGFRALMKSPGFAAIAIVTLALGMAVNTTIFSVVNGMILRPLPVPHPEQITTLAMPLAGRNDNNFFSHPELEDLQKQNETFSELFGYRLSLVGLTVDGKGNHAIVSRVSSNYFSALGIQPALGRLILPTEGQTPGSDPVVVLGYSFWQKKFGGDANVIGKQVEINDHPATIVGVTPKEFHGLYYVLDTDAYVPLAAPFFDQGEDAQSFWTDRNKRNLRVLGRLKSGMGIRQAQAALNVIASRMAEEHPETNKDAKILLYPEKIARPDPDPDNSIPAAAISFSILAALVLLVACFNVANVLLVRATVRQREMAIRAALGARRGRLVRQYLTESFLLALLGGLAGLLLAWWAGGFVSSLPLATDLPFRFDFTPDGRVYAFSLASIGVVVLVVGLIPALRAAGTNVSSVLHEGGRGSSTGPRRNLARNTLVVAQVAGSLLLLIVAGLFIRSLGKAQHVYLGFDPDNLLNVSVDPSEAGFKEDRAREFFRELDARLKVLPGVVSVSQAFTVPMGYVGAGDLLFVENHPLEAGKQPPGVSYNFVSESYFENLRIPIQRGRGFTEADNEKSPKVAVINQTMAKKFWPGEEALGKRFGREGQSGPFLTVVGIAQDGKYGNVTEEPQAFYYVPLRQEYMAARVVQLRTSVPPETLANTVETQVHQLAPEVPISQVQTMRQSLNGANGFFLFRFGAQLTATMGILGLILAVVGVYSVVSYAASQRTHEIGIRMALGAGPREILRMVLHQGLGVIGIGLAVGLAAALAVTRVFANMFIGIKPTDPVTYASVGIFLVGIALLACWIPARRATRVDPLVALRYE
jgi:putative ABC transport system permease protein